MGSLHFRVIIPYRTDTYARVIVQRKSRNWRSPDPWYDEVANEMYEKAQKRFKQIDNQMILSIENKLPNTIMSFIVPNLALVLPDITEEYEKRKLESRKTEAEVVEEKAENKYKIKYKDVLSRVTKILYNNSLGLGQIKVTKKEMASELGISPSMFETYLRAPKSDDPLHKGREGIGVKK